MTLEIGEGGMSIATPDVLAVGEKVEVEPVLDGKISAIVRHQQGRIYGLEFVGLTEEQHEQIRGLCKELPHFSGHHLL